MLRTSGKNTNRIIFFPSVIVYHMPFPSYRKPHPNETHYHKKDFALSLILKVRVFVTRKWPFLLLPLHNA